jgi:hypothetical protein
LGREEGNSLVGKEINKGEVNEFQWVMLTDAEVVKVWDGRRKAVQESKQEWQSELQGGLVRGFDRGGKEKQYYS